MGFSIETGKPVLSRNIVYRFSLYNTIAQMARAWLYYMHGSLEAL